MSCYIRFYISYYIFYYFYNINNFLNFYDIIPIINLLYYFYHGMLYVKIFTNYKSISFVIDNKSQKKLYYFNIFLNPFFKIIFNFGEIG